jgi:glycosyltransferase involved in cell wall biosynthesis
MKLSLGERLRGPKPGDLPVGNVPLVSCIMPTYNRRPFVAQAISYFRRQKYSNKELVIVDDGKDTVFDLVSSDSNIHYIRLERKTSIGDKRNIAIEESGGDIIAHFDDDDWYDDMRLHYQIYPLLSDSSEITALRMSFMYDLMSDFVWFVDKDLHDLMFAYGIHTGSIVYTKRLWRRAARFPATDLAEDVEFIRNTEGLGAKLLKLPNDALFAGLGEIDADMELPFLEAVLRRCGGVLHPPRRPACLYIRHTTNTWRFVCGEYLDPRAWHKIAPSEFLPGGDLAYYRTIVAASSPSYVG